MRMNLSALIWGPVGPCGCLVVLALLAVPWMAQAEPIWCSPFEMESGQPVSEGQVAGPVENAVGDPGQATAGVSTLSPIIHISHGEFVSAIPSAIDPAGQAGSFAISSPDERGTGINTNLRSDAGNLTNALTIEGYFLMPSSEPITAPSFVGRRLATQKRSPLDDNSRLAIGVHATTVGFVDGLFEFEGLDYTVGAEPVLLAGLSGGTGWGGAWINSAENYQVVSGSLSSPASPFTPIGNRITASGSAAARPLGRHVNLAEDGNTLYFSALVRKSANGTAANLEINITPASTSTQTTRFGMTSGGAFFLNSSSNTGGTVVPDVTYLVIGKIVSGASTPDQISMQVYAPEDVLPETEPETWLLTYEIGSSTVLQNFRLVAGANIVADFDDIRVGSSWESVTDPDAGMGQAGQQVNLLATYWAEEEEVPGELPEDPPTYTYINHLEFGQTPLQANTWYHFAMTYDGDDLRWYLNGQLEGEVLSPPVAGAGTAKIVLANNRMVGTDDRGFYGVMDEFRIWDRVLTTGEMLVNGGLPGANLLWNSRFETQFGQPVTSGQPADQLNCYDNSVGSPNGSPAGIIASSYSGFGQDVPAIPTAIDPAGLGGSFVLSQPDAPNPAINTTLPSDTGNLANEVTVQGYFNSLRDLPVSVSAVGNRLVSMQRSASEGQVRLGIGLAANPVPPAEGPPNVLTVAYHSATDAAIHYIYGTTPIEINTWYHFAMVWNGTDLSFYLNGNLEGEALSANLTPPGPAPIVVGNDRSTGAGTRGFFGLLDKIVVSDHVIAPSEFMTAGFDPCLGVWCNMPFADFNDDTYVDINDFAELQRCLTAGDPAIVPGCECADRDGDTDVDLDDVNEFAKCATGPGLPWSAALAPDCAP